MEVISKAIEGTADLGKYRSFCIYLNTSNLRIFIDEIVCNIGMIFGPCLGYVMQTMTMVQSNSAEGFSPFVSFILIVSNLIRVFWWYSERFTWVILIAAIVMIFCQLSLLFMWVKIQNAQSGRATAAGK